MRSSIQQAFGSNGLVCLKGQDWIEKQRIAGKIAAKTLLILKDLVESRCKENPIELNRIAENYITSQKASCCFAGYKGYPNGCCISINQQLVHGIANDVLLKDGDMISFDLGAEIEGVIADTALTCIYGEPKSEKQIKLIQATEEALNKGIAAIQVGKQLGVIGNAINKCAKGYGFGLIENYGGHGIDTDSNGKGIPHAFPFVANKANPNEGVHMQSGMCLAIEPMLTSGSTKTRIDKDGWTVWCDAEYSSHSEHSVFIHKDRVEIMTDRTIL